MVTNDQNSLVVECCLGVDDDRKQQSSLHAPHDPPTTMSTSTSTSVSEVKGFLASWKARVQPKFVPLLSALSATPLASTILSCQIFSYLPVLERNVQALQAEDSCLLASRGLEQFHRRCHHEGIALGAIGGGPMGKVWQDGDVVIVQHPANLPMAVYPMDRFPREGLDGLGEVVYLPVYDGPSNSPCPGIVAVVEVMLDRYARTDMLVAKVITALTDAMHDLGLSLYPPSKVQEEESQLQERAAAGMTAATTKLSSMGAIAVPRPLDRRRTDLGSS
jgi:hypothetical protein